MPEFVGSNCDSQLYGELATLGLTVVAYSNGFVNSGESIPALFAMTINSELMDAKVCR